MIVIQNWSCCDISHTCLCVLSSGFVLFMFVRMFKNRIWVYLQQTITYMPACIESDQRKNFLTVRSLPRSTHLVPLPAANRDSRPVSRWHWATCSSGTKQNCSLEVLFICIYFKVSCKILSKKLHFIMKGHLVLSVWDSLSNLFTLGDDTN